MALREGLLRVLSEYGKISKEESFAKNPLANFLRQDFPTTIFKLLNKNEGLICKGSAGQGNWARGPWVAIFDKLITTTAQSGYYPVYLFREDMAGAYLSLNQGMTELKRQYKSDAKTALSSRAMNFRAMLGEQPGFIQNIDLTPSASSNDTAFYEAGNIYAKFYPNNMIPSEEQLVADLHAIMDLYEKLILANEGGSLDPEPEGDEPPGLHYEDATRFRLHKKIERNTALTKDVKKLQGYRCQVCGMSFEEIYGEIGRGYIEAHHLRSLASIKGRKVAYDPQKDFAVLCANCHRMVHRSDILDDMRKFKGNFFK